MAGICSSHGARLDSAERVAHTRYMTTTPTTTRTWKIAADEFKHYGYQWNSNDGRVAIITREGDMFDDYTLGLYLRADDVNYGAGEFKDGPLAELVELCNAEGMHTAGLFVTCDDCGEMFASPRYNAERGHTDINGVSYCRNCTG